MSRPPDATTLAAAMRSPGDTLRFLRTANLVAALIPGAAALAAWWHLRDDVRLAWLDPRRGLAHFAVIAVAGAMATVAGVLDWRLHRRGARRVPDREREAEFAALCGGVALLAVTAAATLAPDPGAWLLPCLALGLVMTVAVCRDEFTFHRGCSLRETVYHRTVELGMATAWLTWMHGCFVARPAGV